VNTTEFDFRALSALDRYELMLGAIMPRRSRS
jgi:hypothetical protein